MFSIIQSNFWAIDMAFAMRVKPYVLKSLEEGIPLMQVLPNVLKKEAIQNYDLSAEIQAVDVTQGQIRKNGNTANIAVIHLGGVMQKNSDMCTAGTVEVRKAIAAANRDTNIDGIVLAIDSPGGDVDGTEDLGNDIKNSAKPIVAYVDGLAASAGYWAASQAQEIVINSATTAYTGSIGVLCVHTDATEAMNKEGYKVTIIRADGSYEKALMNSVEPLSEEILASTKQRLNTVLETFKSTVRNGRGERLKSEDVFTGKVYNGNESLKNGLVDAIGSLQDAANRAAKLSAKKQNSNNSKSNNDMKINSIKHPFLSKIFGKASTDQEKEISAEDLAQVEAKIKEAYEAKELAEASLNAANAKISTMEATISEQKTKLDTLEQWKKDSEKKDTRTIDSNSQADEAADTAYNAEAKRRADKAKKLKAVSEKSEVKK